MGRKEQGQRKRTRERERAAKATRLVGLTSAYNPPIAEAGLEGPQLLGPGEIFYGMLLGPPAGTSGTHLAANLQHKAEISGREKYQGTAPESSPILPEKSKLNQGSERQKRVQPLQERWMPPGCSGLLFLSHLLTEQAHRISRAALAQYQF